jgi:hypothetical protein
MTLWDVIGALLRRWPIVLVGAVLTAFFGHLAAADRSVYWTRTEVVFLAPTSRLYPNQLNTTSEDLIITAGVVAKKVDGPAKILKFASTDANLIGEGVREGWSVLLPDTGGQWAPLFASQTLVVEVVGPSPEWVAAKRQALIDRIVAKLAALQRQQGVAPRNAITTTIAPPAGVISQVSGSRLRAVAMTGILGIGTTFGAVVVLEARRRRRDAARERATSVRADRSKVPV